MTSARRKAANKEMHLPRHCFPLHDGLERAAAELRPGEELLAYLDDLYVITSSARAKPALDVVATRVEEHCGIASNVGKTRIYNTAGGPAPRGVAELGEEVWRSDRPLPERGFTALGVPIGHGDYVREWGQRRLREEQALLDHLPQLPDLQCAWLLLLMYAITRANHALRNIPPEDVRPYAEGRDRAVCATLQACLGEQMAEGELLASTAWAIAATPATHGGLGLQSAMRTAPRGLLGCLGGHAGLLALCAAHAAANLLRSEGWQECPTGAELLSTSYAAPCAREAGPGDWPHGWQFQSRLTRHCCCPSRAHKPPRGSRLYPRTGPPHCRRRSCKSLFADASGCHSLHGHGCRRRLDPWGDHALACTHSGLLARRAKLVEQAWLAVCREAVGAEGHVVPQQWLSHTSAPGVPTSDRRRLDSPQGLAPCCDATLASPITGASAPHPRADHTPGIALRMAESRKRATYIRNCSAAAASASSSLLWRSEGAGTTRRRLSDSSSGCGLSVRRRPSELPPPVPGRVGGGACCRPQCSTLLAAWRWEHRGWSPKAPLGASLP